MTVYAREFNEEGNSLIAGVKDPFYEVWKTLSTGADVLLLILENTEEEYLEQDAYKSADVFCRLRDDYSEITEITSIFGTKDETIKYIRNILEELISNNFLQRSLDLTDTTSSLLINKEEVDEHAHTFRSEGCGVQGELPERVEYYKELQLELFSLLKAVQT